MTKLMDFLNRLKSTATAGKQSSRCQECGFYLEADQFSSNQRKRAAKDRRCLDCSNETYVYAQFGREFEHLQLPIENLYGNFSVHLETVQRVKNQCHEKMSASTDHPSSPSNLQSPHKRPLSQEKGQSSSDSDRCWVDPGEQHCYSDRRLAQSPKSLKRIKQSPRSLPGPSALPSRRSSPSRRSPSVVSAGRFTQQKRNIRGDLLTKSEELHEIQGQTEELLVKLELAEETLESHRNRKGSLEHSIKQLNAEYRHIGQKEQAVLANLTDLEIRLSQLKMERHRLQEEMDRRSPSAARSSEAQNSRAQTTEPLVLIDGQNVMYQEWEKLNDVEAVAAAGRYYKDLGIKTRIFMKQMKSLFFVVDCGCNTNCTCDNKLSAILGNLNFRDVKVNPQKKHYMNTKKISLIHRVNQWIFISTHPDTVKNVPTSELLLLPNCLGWELQDPERTCQNQTNSRYPPMVATWRIKSSNEEYNVKLKTQCHGRDFELLSSVCEDKSAVVVCPAERGSSDDKMLLNYIRQQNPERQKNCYVVTNDKYRDHKQLMKGLTFNQLRYVIAKCPFDGRKLYLPEDQVTR